MRKFGTRTLFERDDRVIPTFPTLGPQVGTVVEIRTEESGKEWCGVQWDDGGIIYFYEHWALEEHDPAVVKFYLHRGPTNRY